MSMGVLAAPCCVAPALPACCQQLRLLQVFQCACPGGLATLVEKKSRRMELAVYCLSRALESFALCLAEWGLVRRSGVLLFLNLALRGSECMGCFSP